MSKVIALNGANNATDVQVKQQAAKLVVFFKTPDANATDWLTLLARMNNVTLDVKIQGRNASTLENLIPKVPLGTLAELYSSEEGAIKVLEFDANNHSVLFSIELGTEGALRLNNETYIIINTEGMQANDTLDIYATDFPVTSGTAIKTSKLKIDNGIELAISLAGTSILHLPKASFDKIELLYANGRNITLEAKELESWTDEGNQQTGVFKGLVEQGSISFFSLNVVDVVSAKITHTANTTGYVFTHPVVQ